MLSLPVRFAGGVGSWPIFSTQGSKHDKKVGTLNSRYELALRSVANRRRQGYEVNPFKWDLETADHYVAKLRNEQLLDATIIDK